MQENVRPTKHMVYCNYVISTVKNLPLKNFSGEGGEIGNNEWTSKNSKNVNFDWIMNAFFDERKKHICTPSIMIPFSIFEMN